MPRPTVVTPRRSAQQAARRANRNARIEKALNSQVDNSAQLHSQGQQAGFRDDRIGQHNSDSHQQRTALVW